jgi:hypothetical protein
VHDDTQRRLDELNTHVPDEPIAEPAESPSPSSPENESIGITFRVVLPWA